MVKKKSSDVQRQPPVCYLKMLLGKVSRNLLENTCDGVFFSKVALNFTHKNIPLQVFSVKRAVLCDISEEPLLRGFIFGHFFWCFSPNKKQSFPLKISLEDTKSVLLSLIYSLILKMAWMENFIVYTVWKVSKYGVISGPYFPHSDWIRRDTE